ncbi:MAG: beta-1,6-N-acetylglucosaminyltransferase [Pseudomonadota bacterium]
MIGVVILAHNHLDRVASLARHLSEAGCAVVLHIDRSASAAAVDELEAALNDAGNIAFAKRLRCEWGRFSLVEAALGASELMLERFPDVSHVVLISGSCLPVRPLPELDAFLKDKPETDFIESVLVEEDGWVRDGLSAERFTLYFPFSWQRQRWRFDKFVDLQRWLKVRRKMPAGLAPHIGLQWWCLSRQTLAKILNDPLLPAYKRFFRLTWIPDESFFQTLARKHSANLISKPLTFVKFDPQGKPFIFYDDHLELLRLTEAFFVRKIWPGADRLYRALLSHEAPAIDPEERTSDPMLKAVNRSVNLRSRGRAGLINQNRYTSRWYEQVFATARPYYVFDGFDRVFPNFLAGMRESDGIEMHGFLFGRERVEFADGGEVFAGNLIASGAHRDYRPDQFLVNLIWGRRQHLQGFLHDLGPSVRVKRHLLRDPNAQIIRLEDAWMIDAFTRGEGDTNREVLLFGLYARESREIAKGFEEWELRADLLNVTLLQFLERPLRTEKSIQAVLPPDTDITPAVAEFTLPSGFSAFLERMRARGFDIPKCDALLHAIEAPKRPGRLRVSQV